MDWPTVYYVLMVIIAFIGALFSFLGYRQLKKYLHSIAQSAKKAADSVEKNEGKD